MKKIYKAPELKVVEYQVERGFAGSNGMVTSQQGTTFMQIRWDSGSDIADGGSNRQTEGYINGGNIWN